MKEEKKIVSTDRKEKFNMKINNHNFIYMKDCSSCFSNFLRVW